MNIRVTSSVLNDPRWHSLLDVVADVLQQPGSRHAFDASQYHSVAASTWLSEGGGARAATAELIRSAAKAVSRDTASDAVTILIDDMASSSGERTNQNVIRIHPLGALVILMQPLHLIVEDQNSDGAFVLWMARLLGRDSIIQSYRAGRLVFRHAGGKGQIAKSAEALTFGVWPRTNQPVLSLQLRAVALLDSDARFPGDAPNAATSAQVAPHVAFVHVLAGRYIESYVPRRYARLRLDRDGLAAAADAYYRMSEAQRNYFPIRTGFMDRSNPAQPQSHATFLADATREPAERNQFRNVNPLDWDRFARGFGQRLSDVFKEALYRCQRNEPNQLTRTQKAELSDFLTKVIKYL